MHDHPLPERGDGLWDVLPPLALVALLPAVYLLLVRRAARSGRRPLPRRRTASFLTGCVLLAVALLPPLAAFAHRDFRGHMLQHLLIGMYAPVALVMGAPITVLLRALPVKHARRLTGVLRSRALRPPTHPVTALTLTGGGMAVLYFTPLYDATAADPVLHRLVHAHFLLSGCLFAWVIAGPDPAPSRPGVPARLVVGYPATSRRISVGEMNGATGQFAARAGTVARAPRIRVGDENSRRRRTAAQDSAA